MALITHPLVQDNLTRLQDKWTGPEEFRRVLSDVPGLGDAGGRLLGL